MRYGSIYKHLVWIVILFQIQCLAEVNETFSHLKSDRHILLDDLDSNETDTLKTLDMRKTQQGTLIRAHAMTKDIFSEKNYSIIPGLYGFGTKTRAAYAGLVHPVILHVDTLDSGQSNTDATHGTFKWAVQETYPRIIVFDVSGTIDVLSAITITNPYMTIAGQTAPSPGIMLKGETLIFQTHDILLQHIAIRHISNKPGDTLSINDIKMEKDSVYNIVIDHCSLSWATDENIGVWSESNGSVHDITISNCIISEGLLPHSCGTLLYGNNISIVNNLFAHVTNRTPYVKGASSVIVYNNIMYNIRYNYQLEDGNGFGLIKTTGEGNHHIAGPDTPKNAPFLIVKPNVNSAKVYLKDNISANGKIDDWDVENINRLEVRTDERPVECQNLYSYPSYKTSSTVLEFVGSRPQERDSVDKRIIHETIKRTGQISSEIPSIPSYQENELLFFPVDNPHAMYNKHYTNLEHQLHLLSISLEKVNLEQLKIVLVGDSTVTDKYGWGGAYKNYFDDNIKIINLARSGESSKSYIKKGFWSLVLTEKPDYIFIQFGHNDSAKDDRHTIASSSFKKYIRTYIEQAKAIDAIPILVTPMLRTIFDDENKIRLPNTRPYADAMKKVALDENVQIIDLNIKSQEYFENIGPDRTHILQYPGDYTHWNTLGANALSKIIIKEIRRINILLLTDHIVDTHFPHTNPITE